MMWEGSGKRMRTEGNSSSHRTLACKPLLLPSDFETGRTGKHVAYCCKLTISFWQLTVPVACLNFTTCHHFWYLPLVTICAVNPFVPNWLTDATRYEYVPQASISMSDHSSSV